MEIDVRLVGNHLELRCVRCQSLLDPIYVGVNEDGNALFSVFCLNCGRKTTMSLSRTCGLPAVPAYAVYK